MWHRTASGIVATVAAAGLIWAIVGGAQAAGETDTLEPKERDLIDTLSGATLVGSFIVTGDEQRELREERYEIRKVERVRQNLFRFHVRMKYGGREVEMAAPLVVIWSGDTPVITLTDAAIPGMGRYTARVLIYQDHYAGYWAAGNDVEGTMFGTLQRTED